MMIELSPRGFLNCFFRQYPKIIAVFVFFLFCGIVVIATSDTLYESTGSLLVKFGPNATPDISQGKNNAEELSANDRLEILQSDMEILQSHDLLQEAVEETGVETLYPGLTRKVAGTDSPVEAAIKRLLKGDLDVKTGQQSNIIDVSVMNKDSTVAAHFLSYLFALFLTRQSDVFRNPHLAFLNTETQQASLTLEQAQRSLADFKAHNGVSSLDEELKQLLAEKEDADTIAFQTVDDAQAKLADMEARKAQMLTTYRAKSPQVTQLEESIAVAKQQIKEDQQDLKDRKTMPSHQGVLGMRVNAIDNRIHQLESLRSQYDDRVRQIEIDEDNYKNIRVHGEEAQLNDTLNHQSITSIAVIDTPRKTIKPARPRKLLILAISLLTGILCGFGTGLYLETYDERFSTPQQVRFALKLPVMASFTSHPRGAAT
jgi:uncharacterized protein involved in exopolysaccharide biosynthesis